jgi:hypothetical protein
MAWLSPRELLPSLRDLQIAVAASDLPWNVKSLRKRTFKGYQEAWHATLFSFAYEAALGLQDMRFAPEPEENREYDATLCWRKDSVEIAARLQLKELVPESLGVTSTLNGIINDLKRYGDASDLIVAIYMNRAGVSEALTIPQLGIAQLWLFGWSKPQQAELFLSGNLLSKSHDFFVPYPRKPNTQPNR